MRKVLLLALVAGFIIAAPAGAASTNAPSGNSGLSQYLEVVPGSSGNTPSKGGPKQKVLGVKARAALNQRGTLGKSLAAFTEKTAPTKKSTAKTGNADSDGKVKALAAGVTGSGSGSSGSMGLWLPILIAAAAALAIYAGYRQRSSNPE